MKSLLSLCLFSFFLLSSCDQSFLGNQISDDKLVSMMNLVRHGAHTFSKAMIYQNEFLPYNLDSSSFDKITLMGKSQSYSYGLYLKKEFPDFYEQLFTKKNGIKFIYENIEKSQETAEALKLGLMNVIPKWDLHGINEDILEAVQFHGHCPGCTYNSYLSLDQIVDLNEQVLNGEELTVEEELVSKDSIKMIETKDQWLIDIDAVCSQFTDFTNSEEYSEKLNEFYESLITPGSELEKVYYEYLESLYKDEKPNYLKINSFLFKLIQTHEVHFLEEIQIDQQLKSLLTNENKLNGSKFSFMNLNFPTNDLAKLHSSQFFTEISKQLSQINLENSSEQSVFYVVHDNNLISVLMGLIGREQVEEFFQDYEPVFGSALRIEFWESESTGDYVKVYYKNKLIQVNGCSGMRCTMEEFETIANQNIVQDLHDQCI